jgi:hypothetical protein
MREPCPHDLVDFFYPVALRHHEKLRQGRLPLWNPYVGAGLVEIGEPQGSWFYPPTVIALLALPPRGGLAILTIGHLVMAALGMYRYLMAIHFRGGSAALGALTFAFGLTCEAIWPPILYTAVWLPWLFDSIERYDGTYKRWIMLTLVLGMQTLAGFPQLFVYSMMLLTPYVVICAMSRGTKLIVATSTAVIAALALAASQLVLKQA